MIRNSEIIGEASRNIERVAPPISLLLIQSFLYRSRTRCEKTQILGAYVSLTKSVSIARHFASGGAGTVEKGKRNNGWVYACRAYGGFNLTINTPDHQNRITYTLNWLKGVQYSEQEIALQI